MKGADPRIITLDIETCPLDVYCWGIWEENISLDQIVTEWSILSFAYKNLAHPKVRFFGTGGRGKDKVRDDRAVMRELLEVLDRADIVITQNGQAFDIKKINARLLMLGMKPYSPIKVIDTRLVAKKHFAFTSNRLEWLSSHLTATKKSKHKKFPGFELWTECLKDNCAAWKEMEKYNKQDVIATEQLYLKMRPWIEGHPNVAVYMEGDEIRCPKCGSENMRSNGLRFSQTGEYRRYICADCHGWSRSRYTLNSTEKRKSLLGN